MKTINSICDYIFGLKIEISSICNAKCVMCPRTKEEINRNDYMSYELFKKIIDELEKEYVNLDNEKRKKIFDKSYFLLKNKYPFILDFFSDMIIGAVKDGKVAIKLYGYGEPLMNPDFFKMIEYLKNKKFHVVLTTNGSLLNEENIKKIIDAGSINEILVSIDSHKKEVFEEIRKGLEYDKILQNLDNLSRQIKFDDDDSSNSNNNNNGSDNSKIRLHVAIVKTKENEKYLKETLAFFQSKNISAGIDFDCYDRPKFDNFFCPYLQHTLFVYSNGDVMKCCLDPCGGTKIGNSNNNTLREIWTSEQNLKYLVFNNTASLSNIETCKKYCINEKTNIIMPEEYKTTKEIIDYNVVYPITKTDDLTKDIIKELNSIAKNGGNNEEEEKSDKNILLKNEIKKQISELNNLKKIPPHTTAIIKNGRIYTNLKKNIGIVISNEKHDVFKEFSFHRKKIDYLSSFNERENNNNNTDSNNRINLKNEKESKKFLYLPGRAVSLIDGFASKENYFHWMFDCLPRIHLIEKSKIEKIDYYLVPNYKKKYQKQSLRKIGINENKIIDCEKYSDISADELVVTTHPRYEDYPIGWISDFLKKQFLKIDKIETSSKKKIYVSRENANYRKIKNEKEVIVLIKEYGFEKINMEELELKEQINLFYYAEQIICPHGSALANIVFCNPKTKIVELFSEEYVSPLYFEIARQNLLDYYYCVFNKAEKNEKTQTGQMADIIVDIDKLKRVLEKITKRD